MTNPAPAILTTIASLWDRLSRWIGGSEAEQAEKQQAEMERMDREIQAQKETDDGT